VRAVARNLLGAVIGDYELYRVLALDPATATVDRGNGATLVDADAALFKNDADSGIRGLAGFGGEDAVGFALLHEQRPVCGCWYWIGERYRQRRGFWPLRQHEAKLVQITTATTHRGQGLATALIALSSRRMGERGFTRLYARVWHNHEHSLRAFRAAGWDEIALRIGIQPLGRFGPYRVNLRSSVFNAHRPGIESPGTAGQARYGRPSP
jgi:ribosomal protein S18 acetylase RimI-like enzyme